MKTIAIIPARANSKRLPNKNIKLLNGIPLLLHSINYAKQHHFIDAIYVSTNSDAIIDIAIKAGVKFIRRPEELSGDFEPTVTALKHVLESIELDVENVILLQPTNPLRPKELLKEAFIKFKKGNYDSLISVSKNEYKLGKICNDHFIPFNYEFGQRSQDIEPLYYENGLLYITKASLVLKGKLLGENNIPWIVDHSFAKVDIDTQEDLEYAAYLLNRHFK